MQKKASTRLLQKMIISAFFAAMSIVLGKYLAINLGDTLRFSFENLPVILAGVAFGPVYGALVGIVADLIGCLLVGYAINPVITLGAATIGMISGLYRYFPERAGGVSRFLYIALAVFSSHAVGSVIIKTVGLAKFYDMPLGILMLWRLLNYLIIAILETVIISFILSSKSITQELNKIDPKGRWHG